METYRKRGRSVRREGSHLIRVDESGEAVEENGAFRVHTLNEPVDLPQPDGNAVEAAARAIEALIKPPLSLERLVVSEGIVAHQCGEIRWRETSRRVHLSIARAPLRALVDLAEFRSEVVGQIAAALARAGKEREAPPHIRLAGHVGAAMLPFASVEKIQSAASHDGWGHTIEERRVTGDRPPNWFRPSYRLRPRRAWFHLRVGSKGEIDRDLPEAVALLAPIDGRSIRVLCVDGGHLYPTVIQLGRVLAAKPTSTWYPYGAGSFGAEMML